MTVSATADARRSRRRAITLSLLAVPAGALLAWLALLGTVYIPTDSPLVWLGIPLLVVAAPLIWAATRRPAASRVALLVAGVLALAGVITVVFFAWLFWQLGSGLERLG